MTAPDLLSATDLHAALRAAEQWLARNRDAVNAINVYPVPDGDTGTNMLLTLRGALEAVEPPPPGLDVYGARLGRAALLSARGNSGVILSQMLRGLGDHFAAAREVDARTLAAGLAAASAAADTAVSTPVEGTMLTVMRDAARAAHDASDHGLTAVLRAAEAEAAASVHRTRDLLPVLRDAGVVDAGGLGLAVLLTGVRCGCLREPFPPPLEAGSVNLAAVEHTGHGYCTEFVVTGEALDRQALTGALEATEGESLLVVGDSRALHVHIHALDPGPALSAGAQAGALEAVKIENMQAQHEAWTAAHEAAQAPVQRPERAGLVAFATGTGLARAFRELGAVVVEGDGTGKPSAGALLDAAARAASERVYILPNDPNVIMAAEQAAAAEPGRIVVIPTRSMPAGLAAAVAFQPHDEPEAMAEAMQEAARAVSSIAVTRAVRDATVDGVAVRAGDAIALVNDRLVARAGDEAAALRAAFAVLAERGDSAELVTVCLGREAAGDAAQCAREAVQATLGEIEVAVLDGGQPHYAYLAGVE